ncbi:hypothetical protein CBR_g68684 [Chara braunii]|uniref:Retrotransposon gag domain-containing protein n=1 Tax=Chara braunii TaxID=69332 RepID=A0A388K9H7_CHABU|nr:hypothetical protein CBR_g68684 [Chara braunii]|eukprot:GBG66700.1 hypothetical protein CBR_g68684 [Chara braunii]
MSGTAVHTTDRYSLHVVGRLDGPLVLVIVELQLHSRLCIVEEAECVRRALREARGTGLWIGLEGGRRIKYVLRVTPFEGRSRIRAWYETTGEAERLKISEVRKAGELGRVVTDGAILRVLAAHNRYWKETITILDTIQDDVDKEDFETFYDMLEQSAMRVYGITEYLEKWELHACRSRWSEEEIIENFLFNVDPCLGREVKGDRPKDGRWATYKKNLVELYKLEDNKYSIKDLETITQEEDESMRAFGMRFQKISDVLMKKGKISEVERCTIFIGLLSKGRQKSILRDLPRDRLDFPEVLKLTIKAEADDYKDLVWRGIRRRDFSLYKEYATDRCPDFKDYPWSENNEAVAEEVKEIRDMVKGLTRQVTEIVSTTGVTAYRDKPGGPYSLRWDRRNSDPWRSVEDRNPRTLTEYRMRERERDDEAWRRRDDEIDRDRRDRELFVRARRLDDYPRSPRYDVDRGRGNSRGRYERSDRDGYRDDIYERSGRDGYRESRYQRGDRDWERQEGSRGRFERGGEAREQRDEMRGWYNRGDRRDESRGHYDSRDRRNDSRGQYEQGGSGGDRRNDSRSRNERGGYGVSSEPYPKGDSRHTETQAAPRTAHGNAR